MRFEFKRNRRAAGAVIGAAIASLCTSIGGNSAAGATPASWLNAADGTWNVAGNWSTPNFPNNGSPTAADAYDATIGATGAAYVVTLNSNITVNSFTLNAASVTLDQSAGVLSATNGIAIQAGVFKLGGAIVGGTVSTSGGGTVIANGGTLDGVTLNGEVDVGQQQPATLFINHDSTINGTVLVGNPSSANNGVIFFGAGAVANQTISGTANVLLGVNNNNTLYNFNQGTLTLGPGVTIHGQRASIVNQYNVGQTINQGTISADAGGAIAVGNGMGSFTNTGTLETKNGSTLTLGGPWSSSNGTINVNNSTLNLGGTFTTAGLGTINRTGGTVNITGTLNNSATGPLNFNASSGSWNLQEGGGIVGGTVSTTSGSALIATGGTLDGVTLNGEVDVGQQQPATLFINHDSTINGTVLVGNPSNANNGVIFFGADTVANQTISGTANVLLGANNNNTLYNFNQGTLTLGSGVTIHGQRGSIVNQYSVGKIINQGTISSDAGGVIAIGNGMGTFTNTGTLEIKNSSTMTLGGPWSNGGTITVNNSTLNLGGTFTTAGLGTINRTGGTVNITGTLDNTATGPLNFNASSGSWLLQQNAGIVGGTINTTGGSAVIAAGGTLDGVTLNGEVDVGQQQPATLYINHDSTINGTVLVGNPINANNGVVFFGAGAVTNQTISGTANVLLGANNNNTLYNYNQGTLTLGPGVTIHGQKASIVNAYASGLIVNQGTISADVAGGLIAVDNGNGTFTNTGTLSASNGATLNVYSPALTNLAGNTLTGGHWYGYAGSTIDFGSTTVTTNTADVRLDGLSSHFDAINSLATNNGTFTVANGRTFNITPTTFVNNGTLNAAAGGTITIPGGTNNGTINCAAGATIVFNGSFNHGSTSFLNGSGSVIFNSGTQTFNGTIIGNIDLSLSGVANFGALSHVTTSRPFVTSGSSVLAAGAQVGFGGLAFVGGSSPAIAIGAGANSATLTLSGDVSVASVTGTSQILTSGSGANDGVLNLGGTRMFTVNNNNASPDLLVSAMLVNGTINKAGPGTMALTHSNNISGTILSNGTLQISDPGALGGAAGFIFFSGGTLDLRSDQTTTTYSNPFVAINGVSQNFNIAPISNASGGTFRFTGDAIGGNLNVTGNGTLQFLGVGLSSTIAGTVIENTPTIDFNGPISGNGSITRGGSGGSTGTVIFSGSAANSYSGSTVVTRGTLVLNKSAGVVAIPHDLQILGGTVQELASDQIADSANVTLSGGSLNLNGFQETIGTLGGNGGSVVVPANSFLTVTNGYSDTGNVQVDGAMMCGYSSSSPIATIQLLLKNGFSGGSWNGNGINSSLAAANQTLHRTAVGFGDAGALHVGSFLGHTISGSAVLLRYTYSGDANLDGTVNSSDFALLAANFGATGKFWSDGDYNYDGTVNALDFNALATNYGQSLAGAQIPYQASAMLTSIVPEPTFTAFGLFATLFCARMRRR